MFGSHQQSSSFTYFPQQPQPTSDNANGNPYLSFPHQVFPSALALETAIYPPGVDPQANSGSYPVNNVGFEGHTQYYQDPNAGSQSWVVLLANAVKYETASVVSTNLIPSGSSSNWTAQIFTNDSTSGMPDQNTTSQFVQCEVCNIDCNSKDAFDKHILGKKHQRNLKIRRNTTTMAFANTSNAIDSIRLLGQVGGVGEEMIIGNTSLVAGKELESKRQKLLNGGAAVDSVRVCTICNVACNSQEVFNKHLAGKKHAAQAILMNHNGMGPFVAAMRAYDKGIWNKGPKKTKVVQSAWCEVCKINCNSNDVYIKHLAGRKHQKNLESLEKSKNDVHTLTSMTAHTVSNPIIGPVERPEANKGKSIIDLHQSGKRESQSQSSEEDLETKKRKVLEGGAAVGSVRVCTICNVVCNSQAVFKSHLAGQKHAAMVKKQGEARTATNAPQMVMAA